MNGHGVDVPGDNHALTAPERRAGDESVSVARDLEVDTSPQKDFDCIGEIGLVPRHRLDVAESARQTDRVQRVVEDGHTASVQGLRWRGD